MTMDPTDANVPTGPTGAEPGIATDAGASPGAGDTGEGAGATGRQAAFSISDDQLIAAKEVARRVVLEPFTKRTWSELGYFLLCVPITILGAAFVGITMALGIVFAITFIGLVVLVLSLSSARGIGGIFRSLARRMLADTVEDPDPFVGRKGFLGWLQAHLRDRVAWRSVAYLALRVPWTFLGVFVGLSLWWDAVACIL